MTDEPTATELTARIEKRKHKIEDVKTRHIESRTKRYRNNEKQIQKLSEQNRTLVDKIDYYQKHIERWASQNEKDLETLNGQKSSDG